MIKRRGFAGRFESTFFAHVAKSTFAQRQLWNDDYVIMYNTKFKNIIYLYSTEFYYIKYDSGNNIFRGYLKLKENSRFEVLMHNSQKKKQLLVSRENRQNIILV